LEHIDNCQTHQNTFTKDPAIKSQIVLTLHLSTIIMDILIRQKNKYNIYGYFDKKRINKVENKYNNHG